MALSNRFYSIRGANFKKRVYANVTITLLGVLKRLKKYVFVIMDIPPIKANDLENSSE